MGFFAPIIAVLLVLVGALFAYQGFPLYALNFTGAAVVVALLAVGKAIESAD